MDVWDVVLDLSGRTDRADDRLLAHGLAAPNARRTEMRQSDGVPVGRLDRHDFAAYRHGAGERDGAGRGRKDGLAGPSAEIDSAVLARGVRVVAEDEFLEYRTFDGPGPRSRGRRDHEGRGERDDQGSTHLLLLVVLFANSAHDTGPVSRCQYGLQRRVVKALARQPGEPRDDRGGLAAGDAGGGELRDRLRSCGHICRLSLIAGTEHERDLALRRLVELRRELAGVAARDLLVTFGQLSADSEATFRIFRGE